MVFSVIPNSAPFASSPNTYGMNLNKTSNNSTNINNNQKIVINAANRSDNEILALVRSALNDDYDKVMSMTNQTPTFYGMEA